jgi:hypothetical protein
MRVYIIQVENWQIDERNREKEIIYAGIDEQAALDKVEQVSGERVWFSVWFKDMVVSEYRRDYCPSYKGRGNGRFGLWERNAGAINPRLKSY